MDDWRKDETYALVREALAAHPQVEKVQTGPRSTEVTITTKDGQLRVLAMAVRETI